MKIVVEGCAHGDLDNIYATIKHMEQAEGIKIDLLICCGDFQAVRNEDDFESVAIPAKYRDMNSFWKYYSGIETAPYPTLFVGGNHEASNYLWELYYGGYVAPNIFFMGFAGVINFGGIRIGGLSGIFNNGHYRLGHHERVPYDKDSLRSVYHVREYDVHKLMQVKEPLDVFVSHDWPRGIVKYGDKEGLLRRKAYFQQEIESNTLGSRPGEQLLHKLRPSYWFAAHLHVRFAAAVRHGESLDAPVTKFLALDKCLPRRHFLQVVDFPSAQGPLQFQYDEEWLAITRAYDFLLPLQRAPWEPPRQPLDLTNHRQWVKERLRQRGPAVVDNFALTAPVHNPSNRNFRRATPQGHVRNPQTEAFLQLLELPYQLDHGTASGSYFQPAVASGESAANPEEIALDDEEDDDAVSDDDSQLLETVIDRVGVVGGLLQASSTDPNEIALDDDT